MSMFRQIGSEEKSWGPLVEVLTASNAA